MSNLNKILLFLINLKDVGIFKKRNLEDIYNLNTVKIINTNYWNFIINYINCLEIDINNFKKLLNFYISDEKIIYLFFLISKGKNFINLEIFSNFLLYVDEEDYLKLI